MNLENLRRQYTKDGLYESNLKDDPFDQFRDWFEQVQQMEIEGGFELNAMALATSNAQGQVSNRIVLLKSYDTSGFRFFTNYDSQKAQDLADNPHAAILFYWPFLERQIRIEGSVTKTDQDTSKKYFDSRPRKSRISAVISPQSKPIPNRDFLEQATESELEKVGEGPIELPDYWGGYCLSPDRFEFWQGRENRLHDRLQYVRTDDQWTIRRLGP